MSWMFDVSYFHLSDKRLHGICIDLFVNGYGSWISFCTSAAEELSNNNDPLSAMDCSTALRVKTLHISSPILAAKSPFFYKVNMDISTESSHGTSEFCFVILGAPSVTCIFILQLFSNGMRESEQRQVTLRIHASGIFLVEFIDLVVFNSLEFIIFYTCNHDCSNFCPFCNLWNRGSSPYGPS